MAAGRRLDLPVVDLASPDPRAAAKSIRQACMEYGFFYVINHGIERALLEQVFANSRKFFEQTMEEKMVLRKNNRHRGYTWPYSEKVDNSPESRGLLYWPGRNACVDMLIRGVVPSLLDRLRPSPLGWNLNPSSAMPTPPPSVAANRACLCRFAHSTTQGDSKETFYIGPMDDENLENNFNQWPSEEFFPSWKKTMQSYHANALATGKKIMSLIALSLDLDAKFFHKNGAFEPPSAFIRLLHYAGDVSGPDNKDIIGAAAHTDYGMLALLATDGTPGLQICREKDRDPQIWEDVHHIDGSLIVNIGDLLERWTNCIFRSTLHRVIPVGKERYSVAFFLDPSPNLVVKCMESWCSEAYPARFAPIKSGDYIKERLSSVYKLATS